MTKSDRLQKALRDATQDLYDIEPWRGLLRFSGLGVCVVALVWLAWRRDSLAELLSWTVLAGIVYTFWLICSHDAAHRTLTGWRGFDEISVRLMSWPVMWPVGVYSELHRLHHSWNGRDLRDPERVQWTREEYDRASPWLRWYVRHQWLIDVLLLGGIGIILKTLIRGVQLRSVSPRLTRQLLLDIGGMVAVQGSLLTWVVLTHQSVWHYGLFWLVLERTIGVMMQTRDHLEHYGLWRCGESHLVNQLYGSRNLSVLPGFGWLLGGLQYHAVHHGFPGIPCYRLETAFQRVQAVLVEQGCEPMAVGDGYVREIWRLGLHPAVIDSGGETVRSIPVVSGVV
ncbi:fatty acid desaturase family protein [Baaleninema sp.]|uniref:fatty acid desaturase family protein n=1 Tax=Baaleninema sp. TaxID=3101197 RepID=UPI003D089D2F